jgi:hypothetical protein
MSSKLLGVADLFVYDVFPTDLSELLRSHTLMSLCGHLRRKIQAIYEHWDSSDYSSPEKLLAEAHQLIQHNPGVWSAQRTACTLKSEVGKLGLGSRSQHWRPRSKTHDLDIALSQLIAIHGDILLRVSEKVKTFDDEFIPKASKTIDALSYDGLSFGRELTSLFQMFNHTDFSKLLAVPKLQDIHKSDTLAPLLQCHDFMSTCITGFIQDRAKSVLQTISVDDEHIAAESLEMMVSNILARLKNHQRSLEDLCLDKLHAARRVLASDIPNRLNLIHQLEGEKNRLYSIELYQQIFNFIKTINKLN